MMRPPSRTRPWALSARVRGQSAGGAAGRDDAHGFLGAGGNGVRGSFFVGQFAVALWFPRLRKPFEHWGRQRGPRPRTHVAVIEFFSQPAAETSAEEAPIAVPPLRRAKIPARPALEAIISRADAAQPPSAVQIPRDDGRSTAGRSSATAVAGQAGECGSWWSARPIRRAKFPAGGHPWRRHFVRDRLERRGSGSGSGRIRRRTIPLAAFDGGDRYPAG